MIHNMTGGGAGLKLKVVGGTAAPANPRENTVWVNTDTEIEGWAFSSTQPESPKEGMLWFQTTTGSSAAMNIDKKNTVMLYPGGCSQYIGGAWVSRDAQSFIGGKWVDWRIYFYNRGDECTDLTGGWLAMGNLANSSGQGKAITPSVTRNADSMVIGFSGAQYGVGHVYTQNRIDLTEFKTITIEGESACTYTNPSIVAIEAEPVQGKYVPTVASVDLPKTGAFKTALDVSALSGGHFIAVKFYNTASATSSVTMSEFYGEV